MTFECSLDSAAFAACTSPKEYTGLSVGAAHVPGQGDRRRGQRGARAGDPHLDGPVDRHDAADDLGQRRPGDAVDGVRRELRVRLERAGVDASSARSTAPRSPRAPRRATTPAWRTASTSSAPGRGTPPGTWTQSPATFTLEDRHDRAADDDRRRGAARHRHVDRARRSTSPRARQASTFECSLDNAAFAPCTSPKAYTNLAVGAHSFRVRAADEAENVDETPATHNWTITQGCAGSTVTLVAAADSWVLQSSRDPELRHRLGPQGRHQVRRQLARPVPLQPAGDPGGLPDDDREAAPLRHLLQDGSHAPGARASPRPGPRPA